MNQIRSLLFVVYLYLTIVLVCVSFAPFAFFSRKPALAAMRAWAHITRFGMHWIAGIKVKIEGREHLPKTAAIVAMKHQSMFDTMIPPLLLRDPAIVYKAELGKTPFFGWYLHFGKMIPVARDMHASALKQLMRDARAARDANREIFIFPEGTRQWPGAPPDYKPGVAALYKDLGLDCIPIATNSGMHWPPHGWVRKPGTIIVRILAPIAPGLARNDFMRELERRIEAESDALLPPGFTPPAQTQAGKAPAPADAA